MNKQLLMPKYTVTTLLALGPFSMEHQLPLLIEGLNIEITRFTIVF